MSNKPQNTMLINMQVSANSPRIVDVIILKIKCFCIFSFCFIFSIVKAFAIEPIRKAIIDAMAVRGVKLKTILYASIFSAALGAGRIVDIMPNKTKTQLSTNDITIIWRVYLNPNNSVTTSPIIYVAGNTITAEGSKIPPTTKSLLAIVFERTSSTAKHILSIKYKL